MAVTREPRDKPGPGDPATADNADLHTASVLRRRSGEGRGSGEAPGENGSDADPWRPHERMTPETRRRVYETKVSVIPDCRPGENTIPKTHGRARCRRASSVAERG